MKCSRILKPTDINYKIICAGSGFDIGQDKPVNVSFQGRLYQAKMHSKIKGRIDGLSLLYADFPFTEGQELMLSYDEETNTINIAHPLGMSPTGSTRSDEATDPQDGENQFPGSKTAEEKKYSQAEIADIFIGMDSVVRHQEYYCHNHYAEGLHVAVNRNWVIYGGGDWGDNYLLMNEDTLEKIPLNVSGHRHSEFLGANRAGLWFMEYGGTNKWGDGCPSKLIFTGPYFDGESVWRFNERKAAIWTPYIYDLDAYYIAKISENKQSLMYVRGDKDEQELFVAHKGESINGLYVNADWIVFELHSSGSPEKNGWYIRKRDDYNSNFMLMNRIRKEGAPMLPAIKIHEIFLDKGVMWTEVTEGEADRFGIDKDMWICRALGEPKEERFLTYKNTGKPVVWKLNASDRPNYFDGKVAYKADSYSSLKRITPDGRKILLYFGGHGECQKIVVSDKYLYGNFDAVVPVRVPKLFHQPENTSAVAIEDYDTRGMKGLLNPEAEAIWGPRDIRF